MKKTITITLNETLFQIEEDAYNKLDLYFESIKNHYKAAEAKDIIFDIEASICEKFNQKIEKGKKMITLKDVNDAIKEMGSVEEIDEESTEEFSKVDDSDHKVKRLYRNPDDTILGGVCSGIAAYFNIDPLFVRIFFIVFTLLWGSGILIYIILWIIVPKAKTNAQKLEMRGRPVNLEEIQELAREKSKMIKDESNKIIDNVKNKEGNTYKVLNFPVKVVNAIFNFIKAIFVNLGPVLSVVIGIALLFGFISAILAITVFATFLIFNPDSQYLVSEIPLSEFSDSIFYYISVISIYFIAIVPVVFLAMGSLALIKRENTLNSGFSGFLMILWIVALGALSVSAVILAPEINSYVEDFTEQEKRTRVYEFSDFDEINATGLNLDVKVVQGEEYSVRATGFSEYLKYLTIETEGNELNLNVSSRKGLREWCFICWQRNIVVEVVTPELNAISGSRYVDIEVDGSFNDLDIVLDDYSSFLWENTNNSEEQVNLNIDIDGYSDVKITNLNANQIVAEVSSYSDLELSGRTNSLEANIKNYSDLKAMELRVTNANIETTNYSKAELRVVDSLEANATNYSDVIYRGEPSYTNLDHNNYSRIIQRVE